MLEELWTTPVNNMYQKMVLRNGLLTSSKIIHHFENSQSIFTWYKMASMCAKFHCHTISSLENTKVGHFCPPLAWGLQLYWKETLKQVFSCNFCEIFKKIFCTEHLRTTASVLEIFKKTPITPITYHLSKVV